MVSQEKSLPLKNPKAVKIPVSCSSWLQSGTLEHVLYIFWEGCAVGKILIKDMDERLNSIEFYRDDRILLWH